jgi:StAR-related lipid transfer protein 9
VDFSRIPEPAPGLARPPSDIELMLQEYRRAREEAKVEIAQARDRLKERTEQEKMRIRQQIISQLLKVGNEAVLCLRTGLEPGPGLRLW